jgi:flagellar biosynthesis protein FliQ
MNAQQVFTIGQQGPDDAAAGERAGAADGAGGGLVVSIFQAATQINEATLSFVPKVVAAVAGAGLRRAVDDEHAGGVPAAHAAGHSRRGGLSTRPGGRPMISFSEAQILAGSRRCCGPSCARWRCCRPCRCWARARAHTRAHRLAALIALAAQASLPPPPTVPLDSALAFALVLQQLLIGISLGFAVRLVFAAIEIRRRSGRPADGAELRRLLRPGDGQPGTATSRFFGTVVAFLFIVINGHLLVIAALVAQLQDLSGRATSPSPS